MSILHLTDRALVRLSGADTETLLQRLITTDLDDVAMGEMGYGALLAPQGKILFEFLVTRREDGILFELDQDQVEAFIKKMKLYRMRSDVVIEPLEEAVGVSLDPLPDGFKDPRADRLGWRMYGSSSDWSDSQELKTALLERYIQSTVPQAGLDFELGDAFPHDINMDYLGGVDFEKGCYVGQEVVSRMQHRGTARRRLVGVSANEPLPPSGSGILAGGKTVGTIGASNGKTGLALVRIDRVEDAVNEGISLFSEQVEITVNYPDYADGFK